MDTTPARRPTRDSRVAPRRTGPKARQAIATREHLIRTAIGVLHTHSYQGATVGEVAKAAGLTSGALQHHFASKAMMMMEVTDAIMRDSGPEGVAWPSPSGPLPERCLCLVHALWTRAYEPARFLAAWAVYFGSSDEPELRSHVAVRRTALAHSLHQRFVDALPELADRPDATTLVQLVLSGLRGLGVARLFGANPPAEAQQLALLAQLMATHCGAPADSPASSASPAAVRAPRGANNPAPPR